MVRAIAPRISIIHYFWEKLPVAAKPRQTRANNKPLKRGRKPLSSLFYILVAIIVIAAFLVANFYRPSKRPSTRPASSPALVKTPEFRKDGQVEIFIEGQVSPLVMDVEIADTEDTRMQGLMYRHSMPDNAGMYFIFPEEELRSFWMKNTFISLDIIYINAGHEVVSIQKYTQPRTVHSLPSEKPAKYVLEVNAGFADRHGIRAGDQIRLIRDTNHL